MVIFPIYLISYPVDWSLCKIKNFIGFWRTGDLLRILRGKIPSTWWWDLGDWIEEKLPV